jgi:pimeloyl-ACP methyl ester carboxylesterase
LSLFEQLRIPIWREAGFGLERAALLRDPVAKGRDVPRGDGMPVMLIPGFLAGDLSLEPMARWLRRVGYSTCRASMRANIDCTGRALDRLEVALQSTVDGHGRRAAIVGQSRGGTMARILAVRRPDLVERIVCLGSPLTDQFAVHPVVRAHVEAVALLGSLGVPGTFSHACRDGDCCALAREQLAAEFPAGVQFTSVYSRHDGVVDWRCCLDPAARNVQVSSSHIGMAVNAGVLRVVAEALKPADLPAVIEAESLQAAA